MRRSQENNADMEEIYRNVSNENAKYAIVTPATEVMSNGQRAPPAVVSSGSDSEHGGISEGDPQPNTVSRNETRKITARGFQSLLQKYTWIPKRCRYDPDNPPQFSLPMNMLMGLVSLARLYHISNS